MTRAEIIAQRVGIIRANVAAGLPGYAYSTFAHAVHAAIATEGCEAQGARLTDLPRMAEAVAGLADRVEALEATLATASQFWVIAPTERNPSPVTIDRVSQINGPDRWAVRTCGNVLAIDGTWEWEPSPSNRDDDFYHRCRFTTYAEAHTAAMAAIKAAKERA